MRLVPQRTSILAAGAWNRAILTPPWLHKHAFGGEGETNVEVKLAGAEVQFEFTHSGVQVLVMPSLLRISATAQKPTKNPLTPLSAVAKAIFDKLPETPMTGLGLNFVFEAQIEELRDPLLTTPPGNIVFENVAGARVVEQRFYLGIEMEAGRLNVLQSVTAPDAVQLEFNNHRNVSAARDAAEVLDAEANAIYDTTLAFAQNALSLGLERP